MPHIFCRPKKSLTIGPARLPPEGEEVDGLQSYPQRLGAGSRIATFDVPSEDRHHVDHVLQAGRLLRQGLAVMNRRLHRFPFARTEHDFAANIRAFTTDTTQVHHSPRNDQAHCKTVEHVR